MFICKWNDQNRRNTWRLIESDKNGSCVICSTSQSGGCTNGIIGNIHRSCIVSPLECLTSGDRYISTRGSRRESDYSGGCALMVILNWGRESSRTRGSEESKSVRSHGVCCVVFVIKIKKSDSFYSKLAIQKVRLSDQKVKFWSGRYKLNQYSFCA